mgnify:CR=1 FL=1
MRRSPDRTTPRWSREQIRAARLAPLLPLLEKRGLALVETGGGNFAVRQYAGLIVKDGYWRWPDPTNQLPLLFSLRATRPA